MYIWNFLIIKIFLLLLIRRGDSGNCCDCLQFFTSEEHRHMLQVGVSMCVPGRIAPGPSVGLHCTK
jgi:hypothetical protein